MSGRKPRVLVLADVPGWAWGRKANAYHQYLGGEFDITVAFHATCPALHEFDLVHLFEVSQIGIASGYQRPLPFKLISGLTANVWRTWGVQRMCQWAAQVDALHANSRLLHDELKQFHPATFYTPNGVDADFWHRYRFRPDIAPVFGHIGKPNPRKGAALIIEAARKAEVELRLIQRTAKLAYSVDVMREWYQGISVQVTASNMDGTPNPMLEAAACECALLSTPIGNMPEFITPANGFLTVETLPYHGPEESVDADTLEQLARDGKRIGRLIEELIERMIWFRDHREQTLEMGRAARATVLADWTWTRQVEHVRQMWLKVLA